MILHDVIVYIKGRDSELGLLKSFADFCGVRGSTLIMFAATDFC